MTLNPGCGKSATRYLLYAPHGRCYGSRVDSAVREEIAAELRATAAAQGWSRWQLAQAIHGKAQTPTLLMAWRLATGQIQAEVVAGLRGLAADYKINCAASIQQLSRWENGHEIPGRIYRRLLGLWYRAPLDRLGLTDDDPLVTLMEHTAGPGEEDPDVKRREFVQAAAVVPVLPYLERIRQRMDSGLRHVLPAADVEHWRDVATAHVASYGNLPPRDLLDRLAPDLDEIAGLIERYPRERDLLLIASRLGGLTGALWTDLEDDRQARAWLHTADRYATQAGDTTQRYWIAMARAMTAMYSAKPAAVLSIAARARAELGNAPSAPAAQLAGLAARAHAGLGHTEQARAELGRAEDIAGRLTAGQLGEPFFGFPEHELTAYGSWVLTAIGDSGAWAAQDRALAGYPGDDPMDRPLILLSRARLLLDRREPAEAARVAGDAITSIPARLRVPLLMTQADHLGRQIERLSPGHARRLRERLAA